MRLKPPTLQDLLAPNAEDRVTSIEVIFRDRKSSSSARLLMKQYEVEGLSSEEGAIFLGKNFDFYILERSKSAIFVAEPEGEFTFIKTSICI